MHLVYIRKGIGDASLGLAAGFVLCRYKTMKKFIIAVILLLTPFFASASIDKNLSYGLKIDSDVMELQEFLKADGCYNGFTGGNFLMLTLKGVKCFQTKYHDEISALAGYSIKSSGFVGSGTRTFINQKLNEELADSNIDANQEGTVACSPFWKCSNWSACAGSQQTRSCIDSNNCKVTTGKPNEAQGCTTACTPNWQCTSWGSCINSQWVRTCNDSNSCGITTGKPSETQSCTVACSPNWQCSSWSTCANSQQTRTCSDSNSCGTMTGEPTEAQVCTVACSPNWQCNAWSTCSNSQQTRICNDANGCGVLTNKPLIAQFCTVACSPNWQCGEWGICTNSQKARTCNDVNNCGLASGKPNETDSCIVYFVADISLDKYTLANNGVDSIKVNIKTKDSNGNILPNKTVQITTDSTVSATSDSNGDINTTISTTGLPGSRKLKVSADGYSYDSNNYEVIGTGATAMGSVCFPQTGNLTRLMAPGKDQELLQIAQLRSLGITNLGLKKVNFKVSGIDSTWISNIRIQKYPPPCSEYFCYQGNITAPSNAVGTISSDGIISVVLVNPLPIRNDDRVYVYADLANPTSPRTGTTYTNEFISAEFTGMVAGYTSNSISFGAFNCMSTTDGLGDHETFLSQIFRGN